MSRPLWNNIPPKPETPTCEPVPLNRPGSSGRRCDGPFRLEIRLPRQRTYNLPHRSRRHLGKIKEVRSARESFRRFPLATAIVAAEESFLSRFWARSLDIDSERMRRHTTGPVLKVVGSFRQVRGRYRTGDRVAGPYGRPSPQSRGFISSISHSTSSVCWVRFIDFGLGDSRGWVHFVDFVFCFFPHPTGLFFSHSRTANTSRMTCHP